MIDRSSVNRSFFLSLFLSFSYRSINFYRRDCDTDRASRNDSITKTTGCFSSLRRSLVRRNTLLRYLVPHSAVLLRFDCPGWPAAFKNDLIAVNLPFTLRFTQRFFLRPFPYDRSRYFVLKTCNFLRASDARVCQTCRACVSTMADFLTNWTNRVSVFSSRVWWTHSRLKVKPQNLICSFNSIVLCFM